MKKMYELDLPHCYHMPGESYQGWKFQLLYLNEAGRLYIILLIMIQKASLKEDITNAGQ